MDVWPTNVAECRAGKGNLGVIMAFHEIVWSFIEVSKLNFFFLLYW